MSNKKSKVRKNIISLVLMSLFMLFILIAWIIKINKPKEKFVVNESIPNQFASYRLNGNGLEPFDTYFLKLDNSKKNKIYSPLAIKNGLVMLQEGSKGYSNKQIANIIGSYNAKKYKNSEHLSLANSLFIKDVYKGDIKENYVNKLKNKYNAEIVYDSFKSSDNINSWISKKSFNLINDMFDDVSDKDFILSNVLAIDMEWVNKIQNRDEFYEIKYPHKEFSNIVEPFDGRGYTKLSFDGDFDVNAVQIGAVINRYDIIKDLGEDKIRNIVKKDYEKWLKDDDKCVDAEVLETDVYLDKYMKGIDTFGDASSSTDFEFYVDDDVKMFAKDLKEYDGNKLQYIGIMPIKEKLNNYIDKMDDLNILINKLKEIKLENFKDGVITNIVGKIPVFKFDYEMDLKEQLKELGIINVFDSSKADLSNISDGEVVIDSALHKANIEFSNDGIKAAAAYSIAGFGDTDCGFDYFFDVPIEEIDLTFDRPFLFLIRDKNTGEVWFTGTVYEPIKYERGE